MSVAEFDAMCFSPFAIDHGAYAPDHPLGAAYRVIANLMPPLYLRGDTNPGAISSVIVRLVPTGVSKHVHKEIFN